MTTTTNSIVPATEEPVSLLVQAEQPRLLCQKEEAAARRIWPQTAATAEAIRKAQERHWAARSQVESLARSVTRLQGDLQQARIDARRARGALAEVRQQAHKDLLRATNQCTAAEAEEARITQQLRAIAGPAAVPKEE